MFSSTKKENKTIYCIYALLLIICCFCLVYGLTNYTAFWYDEAYSLHLIKYSFREIWNFTSVDVHPPLYYYLLKVYTTIFGNSCYSARSFSTLPMLFTFCIAFTQIRKLWGNKTAISFIILMMVSTNTIYLSTEIRMYSWCSFLVLTSFIYAYKSFFTQKKSYIIIFFLSSIVVSYMHYYALISIFFIYLTYFILSIKSKQKERIYLYFGLGILFCLCYLPWLFILIQQTKSLDGHWLSVADANFKEWFWTIQHGNLFNDFDNIPFNRQIKYLQYLPILIIARLIYCNLEKKRFQFSLLTLLVFLAPVITGILVSHLYRPVFTNRYTLCFIPLYFLSLSLLFSACNLKDRITKTLVITYFVFVFIVAFFDTKRNINMYSEHNESQRQFTEFVKETYNANSIFLYRDSIHTAMPMYMLIFPENRHVSKKDTMGYHWQILQIIERQRISSYDELDTMQYSNIFIMNHYFRDENLIKSKIDSLRLIEKFDITRKFSYDNRTIYELNRKNFEPNIKEKY